VLKFNTKIKYLSSNTSCFIYTIKHDVFDDKYFIILLVLSVFQVDDPRL